MKKLIYIATCLMISYLGYGQDCEVGDNFFSTFEDIKVLLNENNCADCHAGAESLGGWNYDTYTSMFRNGNCGQPIIIHGNASDSYLYGVLIGSDKICGESSPDHKILAKDLDQIENWINHGAPELCLPLYPEIRQIFDENNCQSCHNSTTGEWRYDSYQAILGYNYESECDVSATVIKGNAAASFLFDKINNDDQIVCGEAMNGAFGPLSANEIINIRDWINGGAIESQATLPVELSNFESIESNMKVQLQWTTEIEIATDKFVIEHSTTGRNFASIGEIKSIGSDVSATDYNYIHDTPSSGENYYRLKIVDLDGTFNYSNIRLTRLEVQSAEMTISPNPAMSSERLKVSWYPRAGQERTYLNLVDPNGRSLHRKIIFEGTNYVRLPVLLDGVYYVIIEDYFGGFLLERVVIIN